MWCSKVGKTAALTGVGYLNSSREIIAPQDQRETYQDANISLRSWFPLHDPELTTWTFLFHAACWEILLDRLSSNPSNISEIGAILHSLLHCSTWNRYQCLQPGHDFGGATKFQNFGRVKLREMIDEGLGYLAADPSKFATVEEAVRYLDGYTGSTGYPTTYSISDLSTLSDPFLRLPVDIVHLLLTLLSTDDVKQLRLASKPIAYSSGPNVLPQSFWRSRFFTDFEMGFAEPLHTEGPQDWRSLYFAVKYSLEPGHRYERLRNRKRIWDIVSKNKSLFDLHLHGIELAGIPCLPGEFPILQDRENSIEKQQCGQVITTQMTDINSDVLRVGSRRLFNKRIRLQLDGCFITTIGITTVIFHSQKFISGLRFSVQDSATGRYNTYCLGHVSVCSAITLHISQEQSFAGFELAGRVNGIVGLRVLLANDPRTYPSRWIGDIEQGEPGIAFGKLLVEPKTNCIDLVGAFDVRIIMIKLLLQLTSQGVQNDYAGNIRQRIRSTLQAANSGSI